MMPLRASQVETLRAVRQSDGLRAGAAEVGAYVNCSLPAARTRLERLAEEGYLERRHFSNGRRVYRLTDSGRAALEGEGAAMLKLRAKLALRLIGWARALLRMPGAASGDFDVCVYCKAPGCLDGSAEHSPDCPSVTGVHVVTLQEMWPGGPAVCEACETTLWPGESYGHIEIGPSVVQVACLGCVATHELLEGEGE